MALLTVVFLSFMSLPILAAEPEFCDPQKFSQYEREITVEGAKRLHVYQIGGFTLAGLAIGNTDPAVTAKLAEQLGGTGAEKNYCTWYLNDGNDVAAEIFNHRYVPRPWFWHSKKKMAKTYMANLQSSFADDPVNMVECAVDQGYVAVGCDGMKHRGPSVFAMFLAYAGCDPNNAAKIANQIWGLDTVPADTRIAIAKAGYALGKQNPNAQAALQSLMTK